MRKEGGKEEKENGEEKEGRWQAHRKEEIDMKSPELDHVSFPWKILHYPTPGFCGKPLSLLHVPSHRAQPH